MDSKIKDFLAGVLGMEGCRALLKAALRSKPLGAVILPRTILAWLDVAEQYEGELPGVQNTYLSFSKSETSYSGSISIGDDVYSFAEASKMYLASAIAVSLLGSTHLDVDETLRDHDLTNLGKSIDLLAKAHALAARLAKAEPPGPAHAPTQQDAPAPAEGPKKQSRIPRPPTKKLGTVAVPPAPKLKVKIPGIKSRTTVRIAKSELVKGCHMCGLPQVRNNQFVSCICFRDVVQSAKIEDSGEFFGITFTDSDAESVVEFLKSFKLV